jgi:flavin-binding protein dodecin
VLTQSALCSWGRDSSVPRQIVRRVETAIASRSRLPHLIFSEPQVNNYVLIRMALISFVVGRDLLLLLVKSSDRLDALFSRSVSTTYIVQLSDILRLNKRRRSMPQKVIEIVGASKESFAKAAENAVAEAAKTVRGMKWARVAEFEMVLDGKKIAEYRTTARIYFEIER